jgi:hypothetical protein
MDILRRSIKNISDENIEVFLHYSPDVAVQMVNDLIDEPANNSAGPESSASRFQSGNNGGGPPQGLSNEIDKESKNLAQRIKKCAHFKSYKQHIKSLGGSYSAGRSHHF